MHWCNFEKDLRKNDFLELTDDCGWLNSSLLYFHLLVMKYCRPVQHVGLYFLCGASEQHCDCADCHCAACAAVLGGRLSDVPGSWCFHCRGEGSDGWMDAPC